MNLCGGQLCNTCQGFFHVSLPYWLLPPLPHPTRAFSFVPTIFFLVGLGVVMVDLVSAKVWFCCGRQRLMVVVRAACNGSGKCNDLGAQGTLMTASFAMTTTRSSVRAWAPLAILVDTNCPVKEKTRANEWQRRW